MTHYLVVVFVPIVPLGVYRVAQLPDLSYLFLARRSPQREDWLRVVRVWIYVLAGYGFIRLIFG